MVDPEEINDLDQAREAIRQLNQVVEELMRRLDRQDGEIKRLRESLEDAKRAGKRQARKLNCE